MDNANTWNCVATCHALRLLLRPADWVVHFGAWQQLARYPWAFRGIQTGNFDRRRCCLSYCLVASDRQTGCLRDAEENGAHPRKLLLSNFRSGCNRPFLGAGRHTRNVGLLGGATVKDRLLKVGVIGAIVAAICCFTPVLVVLFGAVGLSAVVGYLDIVLLPALAVFLVITGYALWKRSRTP